MELFSYYLNKSSEYGVVKELRHHIAVVEGLPFIKPSEVVVFETGARGEVFSIAKDTTEILLYSKVTPPVGTRVTRTGEQLKIPVSENLLGKIVDPFMEIIATNNKFAKNVKVEFRPIHSEDLGISARVRIENPFLTGVSVVDITVPLGKGQRELVIGDRKTGKSSFLLNTIKNQVKLGTVCVYCAIGRKKSDILKIYEFLNKENLMDSSIIVSSSFDDPASTIFLAPYTAMTVSEYFRDKGKDVLVVLDDLTTHAKFYREISILSRRFPGRDSYPGDMFYSHARLLERAGSFKHPKKDVISITCLPVAETVENDLSYIVTNLMGMTDGHIFFDNNLYYKGRRPAINISLSVTRVGRQTQTNLQKEISREITVLLAEYEKVQSLSHFGAELTDTVKRVLDTGEKMYSFFDQDYSVIVPSEVQLTLLALIWSGHFYGKSPSEIKIARDKMLENLPSSVLRGILMKHVTSKNFNELINNVKRSQKEVFDICKINSN